MMNLPPQDHLWLLLWNSFRAMVDQPIVLWFAWAWIIDICTGTFKSVFPNARTKLDSSVGLKGLFKHVSILMIVVTVYPFLDAIQFDAVGSALVIFYAAQYTLSIVENLGVMGLPIPSFITDNVEKLKEAADQNDQSKTHQELSSLNKKVDDIKKEGKNDERN
ncbi:phage holin family protein [Lactobacillus selangorensis]|uniref:phage holin family protein n=1 Tax=Lactobacillus selangorensis TaxID=81857 RepID=UPI000710FCA2|nr:phage holin family protein [Lactobacillus selangorensis]